MSKIRQLKDFEKKLIENMLQNKDYSFDLNSQLVVDVKNGGMGSLYFKSNQKTKDERKMSKCIAEMQFEDLDKVSVLVSINIDEEGLLFELDIWKVDFSFLKKHPGIDL